MIGEEAFTKVKPTVRIINVARGGIVDEAALAKAIEDGRVGGAGIDVFTKEPPVDSPLMAHDRINVTPHLGASTAEAQEKPASPSPNQCAKPWLVSWCQMLSTLPVAQSTRKCALASHSPNAWDGSCQPWPAIRSRTCVLKYVAK